MNKALRGQIGMNALADQTVRLSVPFDRFLWLESRALEALAEKLLGEIANLQPTRQRAPKQDAAAKGAFFVRVLLVNLLLLHKFPRKTLLAIPKAANAYAHANRYDHPLLSYKTAMAAYDALLALDYIDLVKQGHWDKEKRVGEVTRIAASPKLKAEFDNRFTQRTIFFSRHPNEETIFQKDEDKEFVEYKDTPYSRNARENLKTINARLNQHWYDLELSNEQFEEFYRAWEAKRKRKAQKEGQRKKRPHDDIIPAVINFSDRSLYRVFNNGGKGGSKKNFKEGGRFYGGWWEQIPSDYRRYITIDQKHTAELDYSNLHPHMLYALEGKTLEGDAYAVQGIPRKYAKKAFNQLLNGKTRTKAPKGFKVSGFSMTWKEVQQAVRERHQPIQKYFSTGYGLNLQWQDAEIIEQVMLHFAARGYPCLPVHDSIIIHHVLKEELAEVMVQAYQNVTGLEIPVETQNNYDFFVMRNPGQGLNSESIEEILKQDICSQYEARWMDWIEHRK